MLRTDDTLESYVSEAKKRGGFRFDADLARHLDMDRKYLSRIKAGAVVPSDELMLRLAEMANRDAGQALILCNYLRAKDPKMKRAWGTLKKNLAILHLGVALLFIPSYGINNSPQQFENIANMDCAAKGRFRTRMFRALKRLFFAPKMRLMVG
ncbi:MAG: hypothetical protein V2I43_01605 [Parvularcula sp.]|jgi:hypothetical protein|nr:hypothetical protein [Parvularcula sp.]